MRKRKEIESDSKPYDKLTLEILLDMRELLLKAAPQKRGRPRKIRSV